MEDFVILVDEQDTQIGIMEKMQAHKEALLHRAVSVFIHNSKGEWLLQQRDSKKYHSNSLWSNTCCTHPFPGESNLMAAQRRLKEEMGIVCELKEIFDFQYKEPLDSELTEYELDHVFVGMTDNIPSMNPNEVMDYKYIVYSELVNELEHNSDQYTVWFKKIVEQVHEHLV